MPSGGGRRRRRTDELLQGGRQQHHPSVQPGGARGWLVRGATGGGFYTFSRQSRPATDHGAATSCHPLPPIATDCHLRPASRRSNLIGGHHHRPPPPSPLESVVVIAVVVVFISPSHPAPTHIDSSYYPDGESSAAEDTTAATAATMTDESTSGKPRTGGGFGGKAFERLEVNDGDGSKGNGDDPAIYDSVGALDDLRAELAAYVGAGSPPVTTATATAPPPNHPTSRACGGHRRIIVPLFRLIQPTPPPLPTFPPPAMNPCTTSNT